MAKIKRIKKQRRKSAMFLHFILVISLILAITGTAIGMINTLEGDVQALDDYFNAYNGNLWIILLPVTIVFVLLMVVWWLLKYFALFMPSFFALVLLIPAMVLLKSSAEGGKYCYKYMRNVKQARGAAIINYVYSALAVVGVIVGKYLVENTTVNYQAITSLSEIYLIATYISIGISLFVGTMIFIDIAVGKKQFEESGEMAEEQEIKQALEQREQLVQTGGGFTVGGVGQSLQINVPQNPQNKDDENNS